MRKPLLLSLLLASLLPLTGCFTPVKNEIPLATGNLRSPPDNPNETRLVIYNKSNPVLYGLDGSSRINVKLNGKGVGRLNIGQYAQVIMPKGKCQVDMKHLDLVVFSSQRWVDLNDPVSFVEIYATPTANEAKTVPALPADFEGSYKSIKPK
jgi:hypothetical protein